MTLRFILGRAGSGKTHSCLTAIRRELCRNPEGPPLILVVPEQSTFQTEMALAAPFTEEEWREWGGQGERPLYGGMLRAQVLSFRRLAHRVLQEVGGASQKPLGELAKGMLLRRLLEERKQELKVFYKAAGQPGFVEHLSRLITELRQYGITPGRLAEAASGSEAGVLPPGLAADKLHDLKLVYGEFLRCIEGRFIDPDQYLDLLAAKVAQSARLKDARLWVDGFTGFTPQEYGVLTALLGTAREVAVTLTLDRSVLEVPPPENHPFRVTWETWRRLSALAHGLGVAVQDPVDLGSCKRFRAEELIHLEEAYFRYPTRAYGKEATAVTLAAAANPRAEVEAVARRMVALCREGYRWREMSVILRDMEAYQPLVETLFADYGIPCFIDTKPKVLHHPLVELLRAALETVLGNWGYDPVFRYLKTDLVPLDRDGVDKLENYVLAHGIKGSRWRDGKPWEYRRTTHDLEEGGGEGNEEETALLAEINALKERAVRELDAFHRKVKGRKPKTVREVSAALYELLVDLEVPRRLEEWSLSAQEAGRLQEAQEHRQVWSLVMELLDQLVEALGDEGLPLEEYARILDAGLENLRLGLIPPGLDQVLVASLERSRNPNLRAAFVLGVNDGVLPARAPAEGLLNDNERELLKTVGLELAPGARERLFRENHMLYTALTRAGELLWVSYPLADNEGKALRPSVAVNRLREVLPGLREAFCPMDPPGDEGDLAFLAHPKKALAHLLTRLRGCQEGAPLAPLWQGVYNWYAGHGVYGQDLRKGVAGLFHQNAEKPLEPRLSRKLFGSPLRTSVSRLERFRSCPFAHFSSYGLKLRERAVHQLGNPDVGQFFHGALKWIAEELAREGIDWGNLQEEDVARLAKAAVERLAPRLQSEILLSTARYRFLTRKLTRTLGRSVAVLAEHAKRGQFRPVGLEAAFGPGEKLSPLRLELPGGEILELVGRIDRIDGAQGEERRFVRVIDYKSGFTALDPGDLYFGLQLQLLAYLEVAVQNAEELVGGEALPAGMLYFTLRDPLISAGAPLSREKAAEEILKKLKMKGFVLADEEAVRLMTGDGGGPSPLVPAGFKADGEFRKDSWVMTPAQYEALRGRLAELLTDTGIRILAGEITPDPYSKGTRQACTFCLYRAVCQFDPLLPDNRYRPLDPLNKEELWARLGAAAEEASHE